MVPKFELGQKVKVTKVPAYDPVGWKPRGIKVGSIGVVEKYETLDCGATMRDPLFIIRFSKRKKDGFWGEELEAV